MQTLAKSLLVMLLATTLGMVAGCDRDTTDRYGEPAAGAPTQGARPGAGAGTTSTTMR